MPKGQCNMTKNSAYVCKCGTKSTFQSTSECSNDASNPQILIELEAPSTSSTCDTPVAPDQSFSENDSTSQIDDLNSPEDSQDTRITRKRTRSQTFGNPSPKKRTNNHDPSPCLKKSRRTHTMLETIFEEPLEQSDGSVKTMGSARSRRYITFSDFVTKAKKKKRLARVKRLQKTRPRKKNKLSLKDVESKLSILDITFKE